MKRKSIFLTLCLSGLLTLSACALFNDDDIKYSNKFTPPSNTSSLDPDAVVAGGVVASENAKTPNAYCFKSICYAENEKITNTYKEGGVNHKEYNVNNNEDFFGSKSRNNYDLYVPKSLAKNQKHTVALFIHGGAWVTGLKGDVNEYVHEFANKGYITATIKYSLLKRSMDDNTLSIFRDLDEIDACIKSIKSSLGELGFDTTKTNLVIGGASSGSHLAMLYSYSRGNASALPIKFVINAVGPVDIKPDSWKAFVNPSDEVLDAGITASAIATQQSSSNITTLPIMGEGGATWNEFQTMRIANGMCGLPYTTEQVAEAGNSSKTAIENPNEASNSMTKAGGGEDQVSVTYWMNNTTNNYPMICAYAGKDSIVGIGQFAKLQPVLEAKSIQYDYVYFKNSDHTEITKEKDQTAYEQFINKIEQRLQSI